MPSPAAWSQKTNPIQDALTNTHPVKGRCWTETPDCQKCTLSSILLQSSKAYSLLHVSKPQEPLVFRASPGQGFLCRGQQSPNLAESAKKFGSIPAQPLRARGSQPHGGFKSFPGTKKNHPLPQNFVAWQVKPLFRAQSRGKRGFSLHHFF